MSKIRAGIVGCGGIATNKHLPAIQRVGEVELVAFCDINEERAAKLKAEFGTPDALVCTDYQDLLLADLEVVYVCTPNRSHAEITIAALESGRHVMCEKPMAMNYAEALEMIAAQKASGKLLTIAYQNRYRPDSTYLKKECEADVLGDIYYAKAKALRRRAVPTWGVFLNEFEQGGGPLIDIGTHALDLTLWMMNNYEPDYVVGKTYHKLNSETEPGNAFGPWKPEEFTVEDSAFGFIVMKNGASIALEASWALNMIDATEARTVLCGTKAGADMDDSLRINGVRHDRQYVTKPALAAGEVAFFDGAETKEQDIEQQVFIKAVRGEGQLVVLPEQAAVVTQILQGIYESARSGKPVYFK
jgi:predicted dehydrogenase